MFNYSGKGVVDFRFSNPNLVNLKSKNKKSSLMCNTSKEPPGHTDHISEDKIKKY